MHHSRLIALLLGGASRICFEGEGLAGASGGTPPAPLAGAPPAATPPGGTPPAGAWTPPQGVTVPAEFLGTDANDTLSKLASGYGALNTRAEGLRTELGKKGSAPAKPEDYTFTPGEKIAPYFGDVAKNPALAAARTAAHKHGIPQQAFEGFINDVYGSLAEGGALAAPYSAKGEIESYGKAYGLAGADITKAFTENEAFANGLSNQLMADVPQDMQASARAELAALTDTAGGQALLRALQGRLNQNGIRIAGAGGAQGAMTKEEAEQLGGDPRIDPKNEGHRDPNMRFDPELRKRYDAHFGIKN